ncbi:uncharacterized protein LOC111242773 [Vigna radiata var. radiata]|uniref:Uncharacterized protein LOC111242773 n=1 Tax=Vigna radiata var. radiata TaxID=3916 RepID=A0A3Q0FKT6_VIGRR|nr:uncharacterized protein LOC111242773 [Vigna radiata var. radiata]
MKRLLARCMETHCFCVSGLCNLQVVAHGCYLQTRVSVIWVAIMLGILIQFLLDGGEARLMVEILPWFQAARFRVSWWLGFVAWWPEGLVMARFVMWQQWRLGFHGGGTRVSILR